MSELEQLFAVLQAANESVAALRRGLEGSRGQTWEADAQANLERAIQRRDEASEAYRAAADALGVF